MMCRMRDVLDGPVECRFVGLGRPCKARQLADELERAGADFVVRRRRFEIVQRSDVPAHDEFSQESRRMKKSRGASLEEPGSMASAQDERSDPYNQRVT
jgi:hypothetical protein